MIIADTGFFLALANQNDEHHTAALAAYEKLAEPLVTTWPVMTETGHLLLDRLGHGAYMAYLTAWQRGGFTAWPVPEEAVGRICELVNQYRDLPMDLADASLVLLAEHLGHGRILSTDYRDFKAVRWKNNKPFSNLMTRGAASPRESR